VAANGCHITQARSLNGNHPTSIEFVNNTRGAVRIVWVDYAGKLVLYNTLPSRSFSVQHTYSTHVWIVLDSAWKCIGYVVAPKRVYEIR
jgi:hypothetical protein